MIDNKTVIQQSDSSIESEIDGEVVLMNLDNNEYYSMDAIGSAIWGLLVEPMAVETVITELLEKYDVTKEICEKDTILFVSKLQEKGIITLS